MIADLRCMNVFSLCTIITALHCYAHDTHDWIRICSRHHTKFSHTNGSWIVIAKVVLFQRTTCQIATVVALIYKLPHSERWKKTGHSTTRQIATVAQVEMCRRAGFGNPHQVMSGRWSETLFGCYAMPLVTILYNNHNISSTAKSK